MNEVMRKKLNLLVHLAKIDGKFDKTEREVLQSMLIEAGISEAEYSDSPSDVNLNDFKSMERADILYWALRMIKADGEIHGDESAFCKALAIKLGFKVEVIEYGIKNEINNKLDFVKEAQHYLK